MQKLKAKLYSVLSCFMSNLFNSQMKMKKILLTPKREISPQNSKVLGNGKLLLRFKREILCQYNNLRAKFKSYILFDNETKFYLVLSY